MGTTIMASPFIEEGIQVCYNYLVNRLFYGKETDE